ncbi:hypothetical protein C6Q08_11575 [Burkholderia multivorans]|nr:hypothetical protein C6Q08_11575 [Burkholderia multivorans]
MACRNRWFGVSRASAIRRLPEAGATRRRADLHGMRRRTHALRDAGRSAVVCRSAWPGAAQDDASFASEGES